MDSAMLAALSEQFGDAFYLLDSDVFRRNYEDLLNAFRKEYPKFQIAYSYKTNYTPKLAGIVNEMGGYAETVSEMEIGIARKMDVPAEKIFLNGPYKDAASVENLLLDGGIVNLDNARDIAILRDVAARHPEKTLRAGIRVNFPLNDGTTSRFGLEADSGAYREALDVITNTPNVHPAGIMCHFACRRLDTWRPRAEGMLKLVKALPFKPEYIDLGGGLYGRMADSLKAQFSDPIPEFTDYAKAAASLMREAFGEDGPLLLAEPGSALAGDCMRFVCRVTDIRSIRGKAIATVLGSMYNINPTLNKKNPPLSVIAMGGKQKQYTDLDFGGYTCIESDYLYRGYTGPLAEGDMLVFGNAGSYSVVLKPPFIRPNFPVIDISGGTPEMIKYGETFDDIMHTFVF